MKKIGLILLILGVIVLGLYISLVNSSKKSLTDMEYEEVDMSKVADGVYFGEVDAGLVYVKVSVTIKDNKIINIRILKHKNGLGGKAESIVTEMLQQNSYNVDAVSGATLSSEAIKSAVSKALKKGYGN
ncbi:FMN-binding protein [Anaerocolumna sp. AGMB13020]|uniref:FMN-binding protein n=1 Tax=Anaerocolumna sp. AGMB13020 TaxID=3081750 RepID=UPI002952D817|nr:FMN-binding protein [Anaerocolumna sp. AGMB13020]WOO35834.1 FMN-binding protein [Anaerocolumna sp. AGMB13020]